jgi:hypothetical protein
MRWMQRRSCKNRKHCHEDRISCGAKWPKSDFCRTSNLSTMGMSDRPADGFYGQRPTNPLTEAEFEVGIGAPLPARKNRRFPEKNIQIAQPLNCMAQPFSCVAGPIALRPMRCARAKGRPSAYAGAWITGPRGEWHKFLPKIYFPLTSGRESLRRSAVL